MLIDILKSINWVDLVILALFIRIMYTAVHEGLIVELFKCFSLAIALFLSFHYYFALAKYLTRRIDDPQYMIFTLSFCFFGIWLLPIIASKYIRIGLLLLFSIKTKATWDRWGAAVFGVGRFLVTASMITFVLLVSGVHYLEAKTVDSFFGKRVVTIAPRIYQKMCDGFVSRLLPREKFNPAVREAMDKVSQK